MDKICRKVAIVTDNPGWHGKQLKKSLKDHGINSDYLSLTNCLIEITGTSLSSEHESNKKERMIV